MAGAKSTVRDAADGMAESVESSTKRQENAFARMGNAATKVQALFAKLLIPVALASAVGALVTRFRALADESRKFAASMEEAARNAERVTQSAAASGRLTESAQQLLDIENKRREAVEKVNAELDAHLAKQSNRTKQVMAAVAGFFTGVDTSAAAALEKATEAVDAISRQAQQQSGLARRAQREALRAAAEEQSRVLDEVDRALSERVAYERAANAATTEDALQVVLRGDVYTQLKNAGPEDVYQQTKALAVAKAAVLKT
jgi:hypothetical protein